MMASENPWFKMFPRDWLEATRHLSPQLRGIYFDLLCLLYEREGDVRDDESWMAHQLHISRRLWRSARSELIAAEKISVVDGLITNRRACIEIESRLAIRRVNAANAKGRIKQEEQPLPETLSLEQIEIYNKGLADGAERQKDYMQRIGRSLMYNSKR